LKTNKLRIFDICSGIGGFSLGLEATQRFETVAFCEADKWCQKVITKHFPGIPIYEDLIELSKDEEAIRTIPDADIYTAGIPCQPFSVAGRKKGEEDPRHLWPYLFEIIKHKRPTYTIIENVGGFVNVALDSVCFELESEGYSTRSFVLPAPSVNAPHQRQRVWCIGKNLMGNSPIN
jgi:DNA (cytosine-5)-methyltransferase 1